LLAELQHRVRNTLAVIRSISRRTAATSETADDYAMHLDGRIDAFARVQAAVTRDPTAGLDLEMLVAEGLLAFGAYEGERVIGVTGPTVRLKPKAAETIALVIHELATNAMKYGALPMDQGRITVEWNLDRVDGEPRLVFRWIETGVRLSSEISQRRGFRTELIEQTLAYDLEGKASLEFIPNGLHCTISLPFGEILVEDTPQG
jgi:two-component sensor histidine kinase